MKILNEKNKIRAACKGCMWQIYHSYVEQKIPKQTF